MFIKPDFYQYIETDTAYIGVNSNGHLHVVAKENATIQANTALIYLNLFEKLLRKSKPALFDFTKAKSISADAYSIFVSSENSKNTDKLAILLNENISVLYKNYKIKHSFFPVKFFTNESRASDWLNLKENTFISQIDRKPIIFSICSFFILTLISIFYSDYSNERAHKKLIDILDNQEKVFEESFRYSFKERLYALDRMANRFVSNTKNEYQNWLLDSDAYFEHFKGFQAIEWADASTKLQWINPIEGNEAAIGLVLNKEGRRKEAIDYALKTKLGSITNPIVLKQGGNGILSLHPTLDLNKKVNGYIVGVYRVADLLKEFSHPSFDMQVYFNNELVYDELSTEQKANDVLMSFSQIKKFKVRNLNVSLRFIPSDYLLSSFSFENQYTIIYGLIVLSLLLSWGIYFIVKSKVNTDKANFRFKKYNEAIDATALVSETDLSGRIIRVNDKFLKISKYTREELIGKDHRVLNSGEHPRSFFKEMWETIKVGKIWHGEVKNKAKDGSFYWVLSSIHPRFDKHGNLIGYISIRFDITRAKNQEFEIVRARNKAIKAERAKAEFLANMSHEIRTPMNGILGMVQLLNDTNLTEEQKGMVETTRSCGDSLLTILNDILDISKIESGKLELENINFNLNKCIEEAVYLSMNKATQKGIYISYDPLPEKQSWYIGDITRIRQILVNFLSNAVKFTSTGGVSVSVNRVTVNGELKNLEIEITDTGIGMTPAQLGRLFKAFSQADSSTTRKYGGTGLGLYISSLLSSAMNGEILVDSEKGVGTTFKFRIPLEEGRVEKASKLDLTTNKNTNFSNSYSHKILLVEDNSVNQKLAKLMLKKLGYECDIAGNGIEALDSFETVQRVNQGQYSIVLMDMQMPEMDGLEATRRLKAKYGESCPPIVAMTANVFAEDKEKCFQAGMSDFIPKPIKQEELKRVLIRFSSSSEKKTAS